MDRNQILLLIAFALVATVVWGAWLLWVITSGVGH
jgi:hypothetical protein